MLSFISSQRQNVDRLLALVLVWNVAAGAFVTLGAPWLAEAAGTTELRPGLASGFGWLAIGVPTQFAGIWLPVLGVYALYRMRRHLQWHLAAVLFYAPQTFAITSPLHVDMWIGTFAATSIQPPSGWAIAVNWIAITLMLAHAGLEFGAYLKRMPAAALGFCRAFWGTSVSRSAPASAAVLSLSRHYWGATPLSRTALARRYASIAMITAIVFLPFVPREAFYSSRETSFFVEPHWFDKETVMLLRKLLLLPMTFVIAWVMAFVWSGNQREPHFSTGRGVVAAMLSYVYLGMTADLLSRWLSDGLEPLFRYFVIGFIFLIPWTLLVPVVGALTGARLERQVAAGPASDQRRSTRLTAGMWLTLVTPLLALLLSYALDAPKRHRIEAARVVAQRALEHFDQKEPEQLYAMFTTESQAMIDREAFIAALRERRDLLGELQDSDAREEERYDWYPRTGIVQFNFARAGSRRYSNESIVIDVRGPTPQLAAVFMSFGEESPEPNILVPQHRACRDNRTGLLDCGGFDELPPRSLF